MDMGQRGETISSDQPICAWSSNSPERQGAVAREIAGKHSPKAIYSSYFQTNTQTFMLAVLAAVLKLALIKSVRVCVLKERESRGRGDSCIPGLFFFFFVGTLGVSPAPTALPVAKLLSKILPH